jgi:DNA-binding NtrC family response regulator
MPANVLVCDDEKLIRWTLRQRLEEVGHRVVEAETGAQAIEAARGGIDLVLLDFKLPDTDGLAVLRSIKEIDPDTHVILMTAFSSIESAVEAMKEGAYHYTKKPLNLDEIVVLVENALETTRLRREVKALRASASAPYSYDSIIGESPAMKRVIALLRRVAESPASTVLLTGESGTGKDLAAKIIHYNSSRAAGPFQNITCSALPEQLLESELFGHERGAFTDARAQRKGLLEMADGGTVFLDEIGEMPAALQAKLLRFLEEKAFKRVGGTGDVRVDVRVVAATNRDLQAEVKAGRFREDLFYRLQVLPVQLPALRERAGDVALLVKHYIDQFDREFKKKVQDVDPKVVQALERHAWPGNVRELRNAVERAMLLCDGATLTLDDFQILGAMTSSPTAAAETFRLPPSGVKFEELERELVAQALQRCGGNQTRAAALLGMNRDQIRYRIEKFGLGKEDAVAPEDGA